MRPMSEEFERTVCACQTCIAGCKSKPGALAPGDLEAIQTHLGQSGDEFVETHFQASEGALVAKIIDDAPVRFRVPSIVPAQQPDGRCVFLDEHDRCRVHPVAPAGCSYYDTHMDRAAADRRSVYLIHLQAAAHARAESYADWWQKLWWSGRRARPLEQRTAAMQKLIQEVEAGQPT